MSDYGVECRLVVRVTSINACSVREPLLTECARGMRGYTYTSMYSECATGRRAHTVLCKASAPRVGAHTVVLQDDMGHTRDVGVWIPGK